MLLDFNRQKSEIAPQLKQVLDIRERHESELEKVVHLTDESEGQVAELEQELVGLEEELAKLEEQLNLMGDK